MRRKLISATFLLPLPTAMWEAWQPGTPPPVKGFCEKTTLSPSVASTNHSLQQETASARITSQTFSAPSSIQFAAAQQSAPKITLVFQNWKMAQTTPKERMTTAWVQRGLVNWPFPASIRKLEPDGKRLNGTRSNKSARNRGHRSPNPAERITHPPVSPSLERAQGLCRGSAAINASALQVCTYNRREHER